MPGEFVYTLIKIYTRIYFFFQQTFFLFYSWHLGSYCEFRSGSLCQRHSDGAADGQFGCLHVDQTPCSLT